MIRAKPWLRERVVPNVTVSHYWNCKNNSKIIHAPPILASENEEQLNEHLNPRLEIQFVCIEPKKFQRDKFRTIIVFCFFSLNLFASVFWSALICFFSFSRQSSVQQDSRLKTALKNTKRVVSFITPYSSMTERTNSDDLMKGLQLQFLLYIEID